MKLFGAPVSPFVRKVLAYAAEKGLALELVPIGLGDPNPEFISSSPFKKMPAFKDGDFSISDSTAIITYLEAKYPEPAMLPADPETRARVIWFEEFADTMVCAKGGAIFFNRVVAPKFMGREGDEEAAKAGEAELPALYDYLESVIPASGYLVGDQLTLADIAVASPFVNLAHCDITPDAATYPKLAAYISAIHARPSFADWIRRERKMLGLV
jgi:glutathione S-transferase